MRQIGFIKIFKNAQIEIWPLWPVHCTLRRTFTFDNFSGSQLSDWNHSINEKYTLPSFFLIRVGRSRNLKVSYVGFVWRFRMLQNVAARCCLWSVEILSSFEFCFGAKNCHIFIEFFYWKFPYITSRVHDHDLASTLLWNSV